MIALDTNILVYAHREDSSFFTTAEQIVRELAEGHQPWAIPWPCLHEFLAIVTHQKIYRPPTPTVKAVEQIQFWMESPSLHLIGEKEGYFEVLNALLKKAKVKGAMIHDIRVAAICIQHQIKMLWTADRDFSRITDLQIKNPLI